MLKSDIVRDTKSALVEYVVQHMVGRRIGIERSRRARSDIDGGSQQDERMVHQNAGIRWLELGDMKKVDILNRTVESDIERGIVYRARKRYAEIVAKELVL